MDQNEGEKRMPECILTAKRIEINRLQHVQWENMGNSAFPASNIYLTSSDDVQETSVFVNALKCQNWHYELLYVPLL